MSNNVIVYGDVSPNVIDGSSIWLVSVSEVLAHIFDEVHVLLKAPLQNRRLVSSLDNISNVHIHEPRLPGEQDALTPGEAALLAQEILRERKSNAIVVRGMDACNAFCQLPEVSRVLWSYVTDLPFPPERLSPNNLNRLKRVASFSVGLFSQTEASRSYLESICPPAAGRTYLMRPMVPVVSRSNSGSATESGKLKLIYSGKFAEPWKTLEMLELPAELAELGIQAELTVIGNKYNKDKKDPQWINQMRETLELKASDPDSGVRWLGALSRAESLEAIREADLGIGWRTWELDSSLEISTKALEYALCGTPPVINRTADHEIIFGEDYPFFVDSEFTAVQLADRIASRLHLLERARASASNAAEAYRMDNAVNYLEQVFDRAGTLNRAKFASQNPIKLVIASHDMKFMGELLRSLEADARFEVRQDQWDTLHTHDEVESRNLAKWADVVFCEWAGPALAWYSQEVRPGTRLISRLHRFEMNGPWMEKVNWDAVDQMVFVSDFIQEQVTSKFPIKRESTRVIPNAIDTFDFDRSKLPTARFHLGLAGYVPFLKRPDRAVDLLERLLEDDPRYVLHLKGRVPWDYPYEWKKALQKQAYLELFARISSRDLANHVVFEPFSADIASWHRQIGFILSTSSLESFHLAPAEGMSAGSIPIVWEREGSRSIFGRHVYTNVNSAAEAILTLRDTRAFERESVRVKSEALQWDILKIEKEWKELFLQ